MTARIIPSIGRHTVGSELTGDEIFSFEHGPKEGSISAEDLKAYCGGDEAVPGIRPERGAHPIKTSEFPNAEFDLRPGDIISGLQDGLNVNFSYEQIVAGVASALSAKTTKG